MIEQGNGNLLKADAQALVNCVGVMGKGIALQFKKAWPKMFADYKAACTAGHVQPGHMHIWQTGQLMGPSVIINFPTKCHWRAKSRLGDVDDGLVDLVAQIQRLGITSIAIPPLGAGNGGLDWSVVRPRIVAALEPLQGVTVQLWEPGHAPPAREHVVRTERPTWTAARAAIIGLMGRYPMLDDELSQIEVQKLAYLMQQSGFDLKLRYQKYHYGPYADALYHVLSRMDGHFIRGLEDRNPRAMLLVDHDSVQQAMAFIHQDPELQGHFDKVSELIEGFETPYGMEVLATVHWVAKDNPDARTDSEQALKDIRGWSDRKRSTMRPRDVRIAWNRLNELGWFSAMPVAA